MVDRPLERSLDLPIRAGLRFWCGAWVAQPDPPQLPAGAFLLKCMAMIRDSLLSQLADALRLTAPQLNDLAVDEAVLAGLRLERPRNPEHGDYAVNVSFLARHTKMPPPKIAETLHGHLASGDFEASVAGGYLNFKVKDARLLQSLADRIHEEAPGRNRSMADQRILLEYVSANPTGPLHIGHGRWAALGDSIVRVFRHNGAFVTPEFYINDAGVQMHNIARSVTLRALELLKAEGRLPNPDCLALAWGEGPPYPGEYVVDLARKYLQAPGNPPVLLQGWEQFVAEQPADPFASLPEPIAFARDLMLEEQQRLLSALGVSFDNWISEKEYLYGRNVIEAALKTLAEQGYTYQADGALWFKTTAFGDEKDRVLKKADGTYTYLMPDIAYHDDKFRRPEHYNLILNIWGADHHGYIPRMRAAIQALGHDPAHFDVLLGQLVNLIVGGEKTRMGKRRKMLTLEDVIRDIGGVEDDEPLNSHEPDVQAKVRKGVDATRFWMVSKSADSALDFDVDLAASASNENPVFYVQYAHARCCSILRNAVESAPNVDTGEMAPPYVMADELASFEAGVDARALLPLVQSMEDAREREVLKTLLLHLDQFEQTVRDAGRMRAPHFITQYGMDLAANFHSFYNVCRILTPHKELTLVRLMLIRALQKTLAQALQLLGVSAPEKM